MRLVLQLMSTALAAALDPHFGRPSERRQHHRRSTPRGAVRIYDPAQYRRAAGWDEVKAEAFRLANRARKAREGERQQKWRPSVTRQPLDPLREPANQHRRVGDDLFANGDVARLERYRRGMVRW